MILGCVIKNHTVCIKYSFVKYCLLVLLIVLFGAEVARAGYFKNSLMETAALNEAIVSAQIGDIDGDGNLEWVAVSHKKLLILQMRSDGALHIIAEKRAGAATSYHRLWLADINSDGVQEIVVNGLKNGRGLGSVAVFVGGKIEIKQEVDQALFVENVNGAAQVLGQGLNTGWRWGHMITEFGKTLPLKPIGERKIFTGVDPSAPSMFERSLLGDESVIIDSDGKLTVYDAKGKGTWRSGMAYGGAYDFGQTNDKDSLGLQKAERYFIQPRMVYDALSSTLYVVQNEGYVKNAIGAIPAMKWSQIIGLEKSGGRLSEKVTLPRVDGAISDLQVIDYNRDGVQDLLVTFLTRKLGMLDSLRDQQTVFAIIPLGTPSGIYVPPALTDTATATGKGE